MSKKTLYLILIFVTILTGTLLHIKFCCAYCNSITQDFNNNTVNKKEDSIVITKSKPIETNEKNLETISTEAEGLPKAKSDMEWQALKTKANTNPLILYFNKNESNISLSKNDSLKIVTLINYTVNFQSSKILITGHADTSGEEDAIQYYAKERAKFAKLYFISKGINSEQIIISSKGSNDPIADNTTPEGRAKNRRVEMKVVFE